MTRYVITIVILSVLSFFPYNGLAESVDATQAVLYDNGRDLIKRGEFEKGLDQLESDHRLFPLNQRITVNLAEGYASYGHLLLKKKRYDIADDNFRKAAELFPAETSYALLRGVCNYYLKRYDVARYELERARSKDDTSPEVLYFLGLVLYESDNRQQAMDLWELALKKSPDNREITKVLLKARKEATVEARMEDGHSSRFDLSYDPGVDQAFALAVLDILESAANKVNSEIDHFPQPRVPVGIYKRNDFTTVTNAPDWSGGAYDGKIRLPFGTSKDITQMIRAVLFHEYAHVVVYDLTHGNCPFWLNEGIAEIFGRSQFNPPAVELAHAARKGTLIDFKKLEQAFKGLSTTEAALAYQQSYSFVNYLVTTYGWYKIKEILSQLGTGIPIDKAMAMVLGEYGVSYESLASEWRKSVGGALSASLPQ